MKKLSVLLITILLLVGCNSATTENTENNIEAGIEDNESTSEDSRGEEQTLSLGETGLLVSTIGEYEITVHSVEGVQELEGQTPLQDMYFIFDLTVKNTGDKTLDTTDVTRASLYDESESRAGSYSLDSLENLPEELSPGEAANAQIVVDMKDSSNYKLEFGMSVVTNF